MAELGVAGSAVGIISLGIRVCQELLQYYGSWKDQKQSIAKMVSSIENLTLTLKLQEDVVVANEAFSKDKAENVEAKIIDCKSGIEELMDELEKVRGVNPAETTSGFRDKLREHGKRLLYPFRESTLLKMQEAVDDVRMNLLIAMETLNLYVPSLNLCVLAKIFRSTVGDMSKQLSGLGDLVSDHRGVYMQLYFCSINFSPTLLTR